MEERLFPFTHTLHLLIRESQNDGQGLIGRVDGKSVIPAVDEDTGQGTPVCDGPSLEAPLLQRVESQNILVIPADDVVVIDVCAAGARVIRTSIRNVEEPIALVLDEGRPFLPWLLHVADQTLGKTVERRRHFVQVSMDRNEFLLPMCETRASIQRGAWVTQISARTPWCIQRAKKNEKYI
jgi:hypothetical protein